MPEPKLIINEEEEFPLSEELVTIGRGPDNSVAFAEDSNVSRYHAEIENRGGNEYWIFDLNSSNGTTLNGEPVVTEKPLFDGDIIEIGGTNRIEMVLSERGPKQEEGEAASGGDPEENEDVDAVDEPEPEPAAPEKKKIPLLLIFAGIAIGLAVIFAVVAVIFLLSDGGTSSGCSAAAKIVEPQNGDILNQLTSIKIDLEDETGCVVRAVYMIDEEQVAASDRPPFSSSIDPSRYPGLADGIDHRLKVVLIDESGNQNSQPTEIALNFDTLETETPTPTPGQEDGEPGGQKDNGQPPGQGPQADLVSLSATKNMAERVIPQFSGKAEYIIGNPQFLDAVSKMTAEYASPGYFERASSFTDVINTEFIQERSLDPPLGYILAMSRTKFIPANQQSGAGLWRMDNSLVQEYGYNGLCGTETIAHKTQNCASIAASNYLKDIILKVFEGNSDDMIYVIAAFGMTPLEAASWKDSLPADRRDFWNVLSRYPLKREEVVRFFAAAIVAENPRRFGMQDDRPLSDLYRDFMK